MISYYSGGKDTNKRLNFQIFPQKTVGKDVFNGVLWSYCENYDTSVGNQTVLTVEGTYTSDDRQGITVSHEIDFGTMQIKRNYLYKVRIALEDPAGDTYGKVSHAINVKDWTSGVTLAWAGDENLYNNLAAANFTVTGTISKKAATASNPERHIVVPYNAEKSATFYVTSTSTKSGLSLTCPAMSVAATAEELALNTSADNYQCKIEPLPEQYVYNQDGTFTQKWKVTIRESALPKGTNTVLTFNLQNALNSSLNSRFEVIGGIGVDMLEYGDIIYDDCTIVHLGEAKPVGKTAVGIVLYKSETPTSICEVGEKNVDNYVINGKALVWGLKQAKYNNNEWITWSNTGTSANTDEDNTLFPNIGNNWALEKTDLKGLAKTQYLADGCNGLGHVHPAAIACRDYHSTVLVSASENYLAGSSGWFLPSIGQVIAVLQSLYNNGDKDGGNKNSGDMPTPAFQDWINTPAMTNLYNLVVTYAGGEITDNHFWASTEASATQAWNPDIRNGRLWWGLSGNDGGHGTGVKTVTNTVHPILVY